MLDLELRLDLLNCTELRDWAERKRTPTDHLDRPSERPLAASSELPRPTCGEVLSYQCEDEMFLELPSMERERAGAIRYYLRERRLAGYPWKIHAQLPGGAS